MHSNTAHAGWLGRAWRLGGGGGGGVEVIQNLVTGDDAAKMQRSFSPAPFAQCVCYLCAPQAPEERFFFVTATVAS